MLRIDRRLSEELEDLVYRTIGCCIAVHRALGPGLLEAVYSRALGLELTAHELSFDRERGFPVFYRGELLCEQRIDFIVCRELVLEIKSVEHLAPVHHAQLLSYMRVAKAPVGLLVNFNVPILQDGIRRKVL